ncbi:MAG: DNA topoisomerase [Clostridiales bacterium 38_11]|nr:MAG: DNA topoisomerase [Clostridiales bacterium 38_11]HBH13081.1 DNA topoisomerase III [Clostridiales bacterium]
MSKKLVLAEKPSVGNEIAKVLGCNEKRNGYMEGSNYIVTWAFGHLVTLADPDAYNKQYASWNLDDLPIIPSVMKLMVIKQSSNQYKTVTSLMARHDVNEIIIATDAGREGELVARWILEKSTIKKDIRRLWVSSVTSKALKDGFNRLRPGKEYENLYAAAVARAESDWIVGINATRALTTKYNAQLSCGRVQTPTVSIIQQREDEIKSFMPRKYYGIQADSSGITFVWQDQKTKGNKTFELSHIDQILAKITGHDATVVSVESKNRLSYSPPLYDLTELQRDAFKTFNYSAKKTLSIMQTLYEKHKALTYPRTDSRYLTDDIVPTIPERLGAISIDPYKSIAFGLLKKPVMASKRFVDNSKVSDHHAIIPTEESPYISSMEFDERNIYELVIKRFLSVLMPPFEYEEKTITISINGEHFTTKGVRIVNMGWKQTDKKEISDTILPDIKANSRLNVSRIVKTSGDTKPPAYFNEGTLLSAMENPVNYMPAAEKKLKEILGKTGGLGTVATRAEIIDKLFNTQLLELRGNNILVTSKGKQLLNLVPEELKSPLLTAEWESKLNLIAEGKLKKDSFIKEMKAYTEKIIKEIKGSEEKFRHDNLSTTKCPDCGKIMLEVKNKFGKSLVCQDRECGHHIQLSRTTNARCPNCHKKLELIGNDDDKTFICKNCSYREKLSAFEKRKKELNSKGGKRDLQNYQQKLEKIEKEAIEEDNPFAALAKLKLDDKNKK